MRAFKINLGYIVKIVNFVYPEQKMVFYNKSFV